MKILCLFVCLLVGKYNLKNISKVFTVIKNKCMLIPLNHKASYMDVGKTHNLEVHRFAQKVCSCSISGFLKNKNFISLSNKMTHLMHFSHQ